MPRINTKKVPRNELPHKLVDNATKKAIVRSLAAGTILNKERQYNDKHKTRKLRVKLDTHCHHRDREELETPTE